MNRCTGHCCERFPIPAIELLRTEPTKCQDGPQVLAMLVPLNEHNARGHEMFTCRHFDRGTRDCAIYETRPRMCSEFPYGQPCYIEGCTMKMEVANA